MRRMLLVLAVLLGAAGCGTSSGTPGSGSTGSGASITQARQSAWGAQCPRGCGYHLGSDQSSVDPATPEMIDVCDKFTPPGFTSDSLSMIVGTGGNIACRWGDQTPRYAELDISPKTVEACHDVTPPEQCRTLPDGGWELVLDPRMVDLAPSGQAATARWWVYSKTEAVSVYVSLTEGDVDEATSIARTLETAGLNATATPVPES